MNGASMRNLVGRLRSTFLVSMVALVLAAVGNSPALAELHEMWREFDADSNTSHSIFWDDESDQFYYTEFDYDNGAYALIELGYPGDDGQDTGLGPDGDAVDVMADYLKKIGGDPYQTPDFGKTPIGQSMTNKGKGPAVIDPWEFESGTPHDGFEGGGGGAAFEGGYREFIQKMKQSGGGGGDDDDDDDDGGNGGYSGNRLFEIYGPPELVNPLPVSKKK